MLCAPRRKHEAANTRLGTSGCFAPEVLRGKVKACPFEAERASLYDAKVDVWSLGVLAYEVLVGRAPFAAPTPELVAEVGCVRRARRVGTGTGPCCRAHDARCCRAASLPALQPPLEPRGPGGCRGPAHTRGDQPQGLQPSHHALPPRPQAIRTRQVELPSRLSPAARDFLRAALRRDPQLRPTSQQLLAHPFIVAHSQQRPRPLASGAAGS
jgi:serine/threonine protein kinase